LTATRDRGSDSDRRRRAPFPSAPGEELRSLCARDRSLWPRDTTRLGSREHGAAQAARAQAEEFANRGNLHFLARIRLRVIDPDLKHGKTLLQFWRRLWLQIRL